MDPKVDPPEPAAELTPLMRLPHFAVLMYVDYPISWRLGHSSRGIAPETDALPKYGLIFD